jgi:hypothetical protein
MSYDDGTGRYPPPLMHGEGEPTALLMQLILDRCEGDGILRSWSERADPDALYRELPEAARFDRLIPAGQSEDRFEWEAVTPKRVRKSRISERPRIDQLGAGRGADGSLGLTAYPAGLGPRGAARPLLTVRREARHGGDSVNWTGAISTPHGKGDMTPQPTLEWKDEAKQSPSLGRCSPTYSIGGVQPSGRTRR